MFRPGRNKSGGRKPGVTNKFTGTMREAVQIVYHEMGGHEEFTRWAKRNPGEFYRIASRLIPVEIQKTTDNTINVIIRRDWHLQPSEEAKVIDAQPALPDDSPNHG
jgi:hypothetical protein